MRQNVELGLQIFRNLTGKKKNMAAVNMSRFKCIVDRGFLMLIMMFIFFAFL